MALPDELTALKTKYIGADTSFRQRHVDWFLAKQQDLVFAWIRAGQREDWHDGCFSASWLGAKLNNITRGFYWVWDERDDATWEAHKRGVQAVVPEDDKGELPPAVDLELPPVRWSSLRLFLQWLEEWSGRRPIIYTGAWFINQLQSESPAPSWLQEYDFWLTGYNDVGPTYNGALRDQGVRVVCWQQANNWKVPWVETLGVVDRDYWLVDFEEFAQMSDKYVKAVDLKAQFVLARANVAATISGIMDGLDTWVDANASDRKSVV